jgi:3',5'-cyclic AMP phosphodiesterase CpdA
MHMRIAPLLFLLPALLCIHCSSSKEAGTAQAGTAAPGQFPDHVILNVTEDLSTSVAVTWRTSTEVSGSAIQFAVATHDASFLQFAEEQAARTEKLLKTQIPAHYHSAVLTGLLPGETYVYRVGIDEDWSEWFQFTTAEKQGPFSFIYFGDAQNVIKSLWSRVIREAYAQLPDAAFMLHAGDLVNRYNSDEEWDEWFVAGRFIHSMIPGLMTPGNHEYRLGQFSPQWNPQFTLPANGPEGHHETCYYFDYKDMRIISLNSMQALREDGSVEIQAAWLERVLEENDRLWTVVTLHHPLYATKAGRDNVRLREFFQPLFEKYDVDLVLQGHDHAYGRGHNVPAGINTVDEASGTVYVVSVSGPKMYDLQVQDWMERKAKNTQLFQLISVDGGMLRFEAYTARGDLYDAFDIMKEGGGKRIVNRIPDIPERLE